MSLQSDKLHKPLRQGRITIRLEIQGFDANWESLKGVHHVGNTMWGVVTALLDWHDRLVAEVAQMPGNTPVNFPLQGLLLEAFTDE
jgi:hypothetical protein